jgi:antitoxin VapB
MLKHAQRTYERKTRAERHVRLFRNGRNQALRIPRDFELPGNEAVVRRDGERLVVEPLRRRSLLALLGSWKPLDEAFPDVDETLRPAEKVKF